MTRVPTAVFGRQECSDSLHGHSLPFENLSCLPPSLQTSVQGPLPFCISAFRSSRSRILMLSRSVHWKFSHPPSCFQTISNTHLKIARKRIEQTHPFLCFTSPRRSPSFYLFCPQWNWVDAYNLLSPNTWSLVLPSKETEIYCMPITPQ